MKKILIVDDSLLVRNTLKRFFGSLKEPRPVVFTAGDGQAALHLFEKEQPAYMIIDLVMPIMDGLDVLKKLQEIQHGCHITVLSSNIQQPMKEKCARLGAALFIEKPITAEKFKHYLEQVPVTQAS